MRIPYFIIIVILCLVLMHIIRRTKRQGEQESARFWERESAADNVRRQDISNLDYIHIPMERLPFGIDSSPEALAAEEQIRKLSATQILNLNQYTNTDQNAMNVLHSLSAHYISGHVVCWIMDIRKPLFRPPNTVLISVLISPAAIICSPIIISPGMI